MPDPAPADSADLAPVRKAMRAALHDLTNLLQRVIGPADLLALRPGVADDPIAVAQLRELVAAGEAAIARVGDLRRLAAGAGPGGPARSPSPAARRRRMNASPPPDH